MSIFFFRLCVLLLKMNDVIYYKYNFFLSLLFLQVCKWLFPIIGSYLGMFLKFVCEKEMPWIFNEYMWYDNKQRRRHRRQRQRRKKNRPCKLVQFIQFFRLLSTVCVLITTREREKKLNCEYDISPVFISFHSILNDLIV